MPAYLIEFSWAWDKDHREYATMGIEEHNFEGEVIKDLEDPSCPEEHKQFITGQLKRIAEIQNGCPMAGPHLKAIHRIVSVEETEGTCEKKVVFKLKPVFRFDENNNPVPIP